MKILGIFLIVVLFSANAYSQVISGTAHGFANKSWNNNGNGQICQPCHTPHGAKLSMQALWNHQASPDNYTTWSNYGSGETSKKCLDCHDGQIALDAFGNTPVTSTGQHMNGGVVGGANLGVDLGNDHPINAPYSPFDSKTGLVKTGFFSKSGTYYVGGTSGDLRLTMVSANDYRVDCTTCHTPHGKAGVPNLLRIPNTASALCQSCHNK